MLAVIASLVYLPLHVNLLGDLERRYATDGPVYADLRETRPQPRPCAPPLERCGPIVTADHRPVPYLRWWLDADPGRCAPGGLRGRPGPPRAAPASHARLVRFFYRENFPRVQPPAGDQRVLRNRSWRAAAGAGAAPDAPRARDRDERGDRERCQRRRSGDAVQHAEAAEVVTWKSRCSPWARAKALHTGRRAASGERPAEQEREAEEQAADVGDQVLVVGGSSSTQDATNGKSSKNVPGTTVAGRPTSSAATRQ